MIIVCSHTGKFHQYQIYKQKNCYQPQWFLPWLILTAQHYRSELDTNSSVNNSYHTGKLFLPQWISAATWSNCSALLFHSRHLSGTELYRPGLWKHIILIHSMFSITLQKWNMDGSLQFDMLLFCLQLLHHLLELYFLLLQNLVQPLQLLYTNTNPTVLVHSRRNIYKTNVTGLPHIN